MAKNAAQQIVANDELDELIEGLRKPEKTISPKYFYDERGSQLFEEITRLPEYYPTETELGIMQDNIGEIASLVGKQASLIEFGSGSSLKTRVLLEHLDELAAYVPVDISEDHLLESAKQIREEFPGLDVLPVVADFTQPFQLPDPKVMPVRNIVYFPGSTIGNFTQDEAEDLLRVMYGEAGAGGALLIGVDLQKDPAIIERAYNDSAGVTAEFNRNMLRHLNREFRANFDVDAFAHSAEYNEEEGRIEIRLVSERDQQFRLGGEVVFDRQGRGHPDRVFTQVHAGGFRGDGRDGRVPGGARLDGRRAPVQRAVPGAGLTISRQSPGRGSRTAPTNRPGTPGSRPGPAIAVRDPLLQISIAAVGAGLGPEPRPRLSGGTNSSGAAEPPPKKNFSISASRNLRASGSIGVRRYSLMSIVWCDSQRCHASLDTLS